MQKSTSVLWLLACGGCENHPVLTGGEYPCIESLRPIDASAPVSEVDVLQIAETWSPTTIVWDITLDDPSSEVSITVSRGDGQSTLVERTGGGSGVGAFNCRSGPELRIPVRIEVFVEGTLAVAVLEGPLDVVDNTTEAMFFNAAALVAPADLSEPWLSLAVEKMSIVDAEPLWYANLAGSLSEPMLDLFGQAVDEEHHRTTSLWRGTLNQ